VQKTVYSRVAYLIFFHVLGRKAVVDNVGKEGFVTKDMFAKEVSKTIHFSFT